MAGGKKTLCPDILRQAFWIWPEGYMYLYNHFAQFRYDFSLSQVPASAPLYLTADRSYRLWINGRYVCRGPARGYQTHWPFDEVEVAGYLQPGHNWLAVEAYNPGISNFQYLHQTRAGFLCAADWGKVKILSNERDWLMRRASAHKVDTARLSMQLDFQEDWNAAADDRSWIASEKPPTGWNKALLPPAAQLICTMPFGQPPWENVEPRGIPLLREDLVIPAGVVSSGEGECRGDYRECRNLSWHWTEEEFSTVKKWDKKVDTVKTVRTATALEVEVPPAGRGKFWALTIDLGQNSVGTLNVEVEGADGKELIDFHYYQHLRKQIPENLPPGGGCTLALTSRLRPAAGNCHHEFYHIMGIRHLVAVVRDSVKPLRLKLSWRTAFYPFTMQGNFRCSDDTLNRIHDSCRLTQQLCALDSYVDTPWREQAQWWGDARVQARNTFYLDGDARLLARGIRSVAAQQAPQGLTYGHAPTCSGWCILPDFALTWVMTVWDYYWQTGDLKLFREQHPRIKQVLHYFETPAARNADGLLIYDSRFWLFEDWASLPREPIPVFLNLWHLYTLEHYGRLLLAAGMEKEWERVKADIAARRRLLREKCFDAKTGLFHACLDADGKPVGEPSVHDQVLAVLLDLCPEARKNMLQKRLLPYLRQQKLTCAVPSAFWSTYFFECMEKLGYGEDVVEFIRQKWLPMLSTGTTWEGYDWQETGSSSCTHAWTAHPAYHLVNVLAGLRQTAPAWREVSWTPVCPAGMKDAEAVIMTPVGKIQAEWHRRKRQLELRIVVPEGMTVKAELAGCRRRISQAGVHEFQFTLN